MFAPRQIRCVVIELPAETKSTPRRRFRPSQMLPWADPYIAQLVSNLQDEVRAERGQPVPKSFAERNELEMPWNEPFEYESTGDEYGDFALDLTSLDRDPARRNAE